MAYTKGPWKANAIGTVLAGFDPKWPIVIAEVRMEHMGNHWQSNAHLIAAAPELLEACKAALDEMGAWDIPENEAAKWVNMCKSAISKAEKGE